jgi:phosphomannomutase
VRDLTIGYDSTQPDHKPLMPTSASSQMITFTLEGNVAEITLRTSGTEPKVKYYVEVVGSTLESAQETLKQVLVGVEQIVHPDDYGFKRRI